MEEEAGTIDPVLEYVLLGDDVSEGVFAWGAVGINVSATYDISSAATLTEDGGVANENSMGGGSGGGNMTGAPPSGTGMMSGAPSTETGTSTSASTSSTSTTAADSSTTSYVFCPPIHFISTHYSISSGAMLLKSPGLLTFMSALFLLAL